VQQLLHFENLSLPSDVATSYREPSCGDCNILLRVLFIGLVLIPGFNVTLNFPASPVMARDLKLDFVSPPPSPTNTIRQMRA
jgi:hypothetical protein